MELHPKKRALKISEKGGQQGTEQKGQFRLCDSEFDYPYVFQHLYLFY
jgi:hypothetical protein